MEWYYWGLLAGYYILSNYLLYKAWVKDFDYTADYMILCLTLFWIVGPFIWLTLVTKNKVLIKKR